MRDAVVRSTVFVGGMFGLSRVIVNARFQRKTVSDINRLRRKIAGELVWLIYAEESMISEISLWRASVGLHLMELKVRLHLRSKNW